MSEFEVTAYYTPIEVDFYSRFPTAAQHTIRTVDDETLTLNEEFVKDVEIQYWGKIKDGRYLGYWDEAWHFLGSPPLDFQGGPLSIDSNANSVATDLAVIPYGTTLTIPTLRSPFRTHRFVARDIGPAIQGRHIDVYTGEGEHARQQALEIIGDGLPIHTVCIR